MQGRATVRYNERNSGRAMQYTPYLSGGYPSYLLESMQSPSLYRVAGSKGPSSKPGVNMFVWFLERR